VVGGNLEALALSEYLQTLGILVPAIRPPTVPVNTARLRISLSAAHSLEDVKALIDAIHQAEATL
jgi:8-amino-7-oxononanoate synthase